MTLPHPYRRKVRSRPTGTVITSRHVLEGAEPVVLVMHLRGGGWYLLGSEKPSEVRTAWFHEVPDPDRSLHDLWPLPVGWLARRSEDGAWVKQENEDDTDNFVSTTAHGFLPDFSKNGAFDHVFCGEHAIPGADCPNCRKPLLRLLTLDTADPQLELDELGIPQVHLLFCWTCKLARAGTSYRMRSDGGIEFLQFRRGGVRNDFPYPNYPRAFPGSSFLLKPVPASEEEIVAALNSGELHVADLEKEDEHLSVPRHQIGGRPRFLQGAPCELCPICSQPMAFLASLGDDTLGGAGFTGNNFVQMLFLICKRDAVVLSTQQGD